MKQFSIYCNHKLGKFALAQNGFQWSAFFFWWLWAISKEMIGDGHVIFALFIPMGLIPLIILTSSIDAGQYAIGFLKLLGYFCVVGGIWGWQGNKWHKASLLKRGFSILNTFDAISTKEVHAKVEVLEKKRAYELKQLEEEAESERIKKKNEAEAERRRQEEAERLRILGLPKLINCPDCNREISRRAAACPHCGAPNEKSSDGNGMATDVISPQGIVKSAAAIPRCPTCQSGNIDKISLASKAGSVALVGALAIGKVSKTFQCNSCGYQW